MRDSTVRHLSYSPSFPFRRFNLTVNASSVSVTQITLPATHHASKIGLLTDWGARTEKVQDLDWLYDGVFSTISESLRDSFERAC
jgi:hypothetical protein